VARTLGAQVERNGTVAVGDDFSVPGNPECFVVGDAAHVIGPGGRPGPGLASIAQQQGRYVGRLIAARLADSAPPSLPKPFVPEKLATIIRHVGIAEFGGRSITGFPAWLMWGLLHLRRLAEGHSKLSILAKLASPFDHLPPQCTVDRRASRAGRFRSFCSSSRRPRANGQRNA
jgi:NADH dehydrogenase